METLNMQELVAVQGGFGHVSYQEPYTSDTAVYDGMILGGSLGVLFGTSLGAASLTQAVVLGGMFGAFIGALGHRNEQQVVYCAK